MGHWQQVKIRIGRECEEAAGEVLQALGASGYSVEDPELSYGSDVRRISDYVPEQDNDGHVILRAYFQPAVAPEQLARLEQDLSYLRHYGLSVGALSVETSMIREEDWAHAWKQYYHTEVFGRIVVRPTWEAYQPQPDQVVVEIDPGMAFGTGGHPSTSMCLYALQELDLSERCFWDVGTGSGILSCAAGKLGASPIAACDVDVTAVKTARDNMKCNGVKGHCVQGTIDSLTGTADVIAANIMADVIIELMPIIPSKLRPGGRFIGSGIIDTRVPDCQEAAAAHDMEILQEWREGEWYTFLAAAKGKGKGAL